MILARIEGNVAPTRKHPSFESWRLLICQPIGAAGEPEGSPQVAIDAQGAGLHQHVILSSDGSAARAAVGDPKSPARWMVIGIVDEPATGSERMRLGTVIGRVTLGKTVEGLRGARWLVVSPFTREHFKPASKAPAVSKEPSLVVYDDLGGGVGQTIGFIEGREAAMPFDQPTPIDAIDAALVDNIFYSPLP